MEYKDFQFNNARKQIKEIVPKIYTIDTDNHVIIDNLSTHKYHYELVNDNNLAHYIIVTMHDMEHIEFIIKLNDDGLELIEGRYNGKKCKADRTLKKFEKLVTLVYSMYLEQML